MDYSAYLPLQISYFHSQLPPTFYYQFPTQFIDFSYSYSSPTAAYPGCRAVSQDDIKPSMIDRTGPCRDGSSS
jgi:hypothetical protein